MSADRCRLKKKGEHIFLNNAVKDKDRKMAVLVDSMKKLLSQDLLNQIYKSIQKEW